MSDDASENRYYPIRQLPRHTTYILQELAQAAEAYHSCLSQFVGKPDRWCGIYLREEKLARSGHDIVELVEELQPWIERRCVTRAIRREVERLAFLVREQFEEWGWSRYLGQFGIGSLEAALDRHRAKREIPFRQATLAWRNSPGVERHHAADRIADESQTYGIEPMSGLSADEARELSFRLHDEWMTCPALASAVPSPTPEQFWEIQEILYEIKGFTRYLVSPDELKRLWGVECDGDEDTNLETEDVHERRPSSDIQPVECVERQRLSRAQCAAILREQLPSLRAVLKQLVSNPSDAFALTALQARRSNIGRAFDDWIGPVSVESATSPEAICFNALWRLVESLRANDFQASLSYSDALTVAFETIPDHQGEVGGIESTVFLGSQQEANNWCSLTEAMRNILEACYRLGSLSEETRKSQSVIAQKAGVSIGVGNTAGAFSELVRRGLMKSKTGRRGGMWLTQEGNGLYRNREKQ